MYYDRQTSRLVYYSDDGNKLQDEAAALTAWLKAFHYTVQKWNNRPNWQLGLVTCVREGEVAWSCQAQQISWFWAARQTVSQLAR